MQIGQTLALCTLLAAALAAPARALTLNSLADFSATDNPNGPWSYRAVAKGDANSDSFPLLACCLTSPSGHQAWVDAGTYPFTGGGVIHPGPTNDALLGFEMLPAFAPGNVLVQLSMQDGNLGGDGMVASLWRNDTLLQSINLAANFYPDPVSLDINVALATGDVLYLRVNDNGDFFFDGARFELSVSLAVPEPGTAALAGVAALGLLGLGRRLARGARR